MNDRTQKRNLALLLLIAGLFLTSSAGAWAWFHVSPRQYPVSYRFIPRAKIEGYEFKSEVVAEEAVEILATTNLINGSFVRGTRDRFGVFMGNWSAATAREMSVVQHTPDICWVSAGAKPLELGQPSRVDFDFNGIRLPFECRAYQLGKDYPPELTVWCAMASGQLLDEGGRVSGDLENEWDKQKNIARANRTRSLNTFFSAIQQRIPANGTKQFVRFSASVRSDWRITLVEMKEFARKWLELEVTHPEEKN